MGRLRRKPGMVEALSLFPELVVITDEKFYGNGNWKARFPVSGPLFLELGTGKGRFLQEMARLHPDCCFVGLEKEPGVLIQAVRKTRELELTNLKFILGDVQWLDRMFAPAEVDGIFIHFCDPWPKKRHHKRRIVQPAFAELVRSKLKIGGVLHMATDWQPYAEHMLEVMSLAPGYHNVAGSAGYVERPSERPVTKFEKRGERLGHGVWDLKFQRCE